MGAIDFSINEDLLAFFRTKLDLQWFAETGTFEGNSLHLAAKQFPRCLSVELSPAYFEKAKLRFKDSPNVELFCGTSPDILRAQSARLQQSAGLFWLDAHWCVAQDTAGADSQSPLLGELVAIEKLHPRSVVLIDDARLFLCAPPSPHRYQDWPGLNEIVLSLRQLGPDHVLSVYNDVIAFYPKSVAADFDKFAYDRGVDWLKIASGFRHLSAAQEARKRRRNPFKLLFGR